MNIIFALVLFAQIGPSEGPAGQPPSIQPNPQIESGTTPPKIADTTQTTGVSSQSNQAQRASPPEQQGQGSIWPTLIFFAAMIAVFYFLIIRPQQKQRKKQEEFLASLKVGDTVVTQAGILGKITSMEDNIVTLEIAKDVKVKILKQAIIQHKTEEGKTSGKT